MQKKISTFKEKTTSLVASFFSVFFSLSILLEAKKYTEGYVFIVLAVFTFLFLIFNEWVKVRELKKLYTGNRSFMAITAFSLSLVFSIGLSGIGIYFWTNDASTRLYEAQLQKSQQISELNKLYQLEIDSIYSLSVNETPEYIEASNTLEFWKTRNTRDAEERELARKNVENSQKALAAISDKFEQNKVKLIESKKALLSNEVVVIEANFSMVTNKQSKNNFITFIFLGLTLLTEIIILYLAKDLSDVEVKKEASSVTHEEYNLFKNALTNFVRLNGEKSTATFAEFFAKTGLDWDNCKKLRKLLERTNLISSDFGSKSITLLHAPTEILTQFDNTYKVTLKQ